MLKLWWNEWYLQNPHKKNSLIKSNLPLKNCRGAVIYEKFESLKKVESAKMRDYKLFHAAFIFLPSFRWNFHECFRETFLILLFFFSLEKHSEHIKRISYVQKRKYFILFIGEDEFKILFDHEAINLCVISAIERGRNSYRAQKD